jgi:hypothetical protein
MRPPGPAARLAGGLLVLVLLAGGGVAFADSGAEGEGNAASDPLDGLFEEPPEGEQEQEEQQEEEQQEEADDGSASDSLRSLFETSDTVDIEGSVGATAGVGAGWTEYPTVTGVWDDYTVSLNLSTRTGLTFDARPDPTLRVFGSLFTEIDPPEDLYTWSGIQVDELFFDYVWADSVFTRIGTFRKRWGQARIFTPGNLAGDFGDGDDETNDGSGADELSVRASLPTVLDGITVLTMAREEYFEDEALPGYRAVAYAGRLDWVVGPALFSVGGRWRAPEGAAGLFSTKTVVLGTDLLGDLVFYYDENEDTAVAVVTGFYREIRDIRLYGEYYFDGRTEGGDDHNVGLVAAIPRILGSPWGIGLNWEHTFVDDSGRLVSGISWSPLQFISARLGVPWVYGADGSRYVEDNEDPQDRRLAIGLELVLEATF